MTSFNRRHLLGAGALAIGAGSICLASTASAAAHRVMEPVRGMRLPLGGQEIAIDIIQGRSGTARKRPVILYCGGADFVRAQDGARVTRTLREFGDVVVWDYPGRGQSTGFPDPLTAERVVRGLARWISRQAEGRPLIVWGHSLGGFVGSQIVRHANADALILETAAPGAKAALDAAGVVVPDAFQRLLPFLARYDIPNALRTYKGRVLVLGAGRDRVLPVQLSQSLASSIHGADYVEIPAASHFNTLTQPQTRKAVTALINRLSSDRRL